ncbi:superoxide dismutase [Bacillus sp. FJAT-27225]|uniref:superoxide dismutase n=1 Tax=Bacillus sp. FJAT-27225 TaxID=1743144 RepID=UPI00098187E6
MKRLTNTFSMEQESSRLLEEYKQSLDNFSEELEYKLEDRALQTEEYANNAEKKANYLYEQWLQYEEKEYGGQFIRQIPAGKHTLPPLPYEYGALEPYISRRIMLLHHTQHHQSYVDGLNKAETEMARARETNDFNLLKHWEREAAFHGAGHYLHTLFWETMAPNAGGRPQGPLLNEINKTFGGFEKFKVHFSEAAKKVEGSGWAILVWSPRAQRTEILQAEKHQNQSQWDVIPLLPLDVWEHAYYLQYENNRSKYVDNWWNVINWPAVSRRYDEAIKVKWQPY